MTFEKTTLTQIKFKTSPLKYKGKFNLAPLKLFSKLYEKNSYVFFLESVEGPKKFARYSFVGFDPRIVIRIKDADVEVLDNDTDKILQFKTNLPLNFIKKIMKNYHTSDKSTRFLGGTVGYISYDAIRYWEKIPYQAKDDLVFPDIEVGLYSDCVIFDHMENKVIYYYLESNRISELNEILNGDYENGEELFYTHPKLNFSREKFEHSVEKAKEYIFSGEIFQVVLSKRYEFNIKGNLIRFYRKLRRINPSPYMYFLKMGDRQIIGSSPEMLARVENDIVETFPIAGTRPRKKGKAENAALKKDLLSDPKEIAEHVMLVDLARNDIGKVSRYGDVKVSNFMHVQKYSHVYHVVSQVLGKLRNGYDSYDVLKAVFPAGTVSGAPKVRAMEIIEGLEPTRRGPYAGAVGYFSFNGNADFAITIRTLIVKGDKGFIQVGAGIVADSKPENEWFETEHKARALFEALKLSGEQI